MSKGYASMVASTHWRRMAREARWAGSFVVCNPAASSASVTVEIALLTGSASRGRDSRSTLANGVSQEAASGEINAILHELRPNAGTTAFELAREQEELVVDMLTRRPAP